MHRGAWKMIMCACVHVGACLCVSEQKLNRSSTRVPYFNTLAPPPGVLYDIVVGCNGNSRKAAVFGHKVIYYHFHKLGRKVL